MKAQLWISALLLSFAAASSAQASNGPLRCTIQTYTGHYLTAVGAGGRLSDVVHTDANQAKAWEIFTLVDANVGTPVVQYGIRTQKGYYLTAMGGGGRITDVLHSNATRLNAWERFTFISLGRGYYAIRTVGGRYLTAVGGGGRITDVLHSDATQVKAWERFFVKCGL